ncbi:MAG: hypothetical protein QM761_01985 [Pseudoxanthomonas sp.]
MNASQRPLWFWIVAVLALLWNLLGVLMFCRQVTMTPEALAALPLEQQQVIAATPGWVNVFYAIAVFAGALGSLGLVLRKRWAVTLLLLSLLGVLADMLALYATTPLWSLTGAAGTAFPLLLIAICLLLWLFARRAAARGWIA